ncbi:hypothetical protein RCH07_003831 [Arthrobacter sp. CG_A4]|nr:hypothetical protein [Arthrobacter sp. CG_A4]
MSKVFDENLWPKLYAVVLEHDALGGRRVRWNATYQSWVTTRDYDRYLDFPWESRPGMTMGLEDRPSEDQYTTAHQVIQDWTTATKRFGGCERCGSSDLKLHFVTPDVHGEPAVYCVQSPAYSVVDSTGGTCRLKHWGSPFGCQSVEAYIDRGTWAEPRTGTRAAFLYGRPLTAEQVINRDWCARCTGAASNVRHNAAAGHEDPDEWAYQRATQELKGLARRLLEN